MEKLKYAKNIHLKTNANGILQSPTKIHYYQFDLQSEIMMAYKYIALRLFSSYCIKYFTCIYCALATYYT